MYCQHVVQIHLKKIKNTEMKTNLFCMLFLCQIGSISLLLTPRMVRRAKILIKTTVERKWKDFPKISKCGC